MSGRDDVFLSDQHAPALVLGEQSQPSGFPDQHLPRPFAESRARPADDPTVFPHQRPYTAHWKHQTQRAINRRTRRHGKSRVKLSVWSENSACSYLFESFSKSSSEQFESFRKFYTHRCAWVCSPAMTKNRHNYANICISVFKVSKMLAPIWSGLQYKRVAACPPN